VKNVPLKSSVQRGFREGSERVQRGFKEGKPFELSLNPQPTPNYLPFIPEQNLEINMKLTPSLSQFEEMEKFCSVSLLN